MNLHRLGKFEILQPLGRGGMGEVFLARDPAIGRSVALKTIGRDWASAPGARERFLREARAAGALSHPNLVTIHEFGEEEGTLYIVMEFLPGRDLTTFMADRSLTPAEAMEVMAQVLDGLAYAHAKGVLHRDIKPSNVRVWRDEGRLRVKIMDFGVARMQDSDLTGTGGLVGTFAYMSPEYLQTGRADTRSDLYAVGVMLHEALTGHRPFQGDDTPMGGFLSDPAEGVRPAEPIPVPYRPLLDRALALDPTQRYQSASEFAQVLRDTLSGAAPAQSLVRRDPAATVVSAPKPGTLQVVQAPGQVSTLQDRGLRTTHTRLDLGLPASVPEPERPNRLLWVGAGTVLALAAGMVFWGRQPAPRPVPDAGAGTQAVQEPAPAPAQQRPAQDSAPALQPPVQTQPQPAAQAPVQTQPQAPPPVQEQRAQPSPQSTTLAQLQEAESMLQSRPERALDMAQRVLREERGNAMAYALSVVAHYRLGHMNDIVPTFEAARRQGVEGRQIGSFPFFRTMMDEERMNRRMSREVHEGLRAYLPAPPDGGEGGGPQGGPQGGPMGGRRP